MIESALLQKMIAERSHDLILDVLKVRFGAVPRDVTKPPRGIVADKQLRQLHSLALKCPDVEAFRGAISSISGSRSRNSLSAS